MHRICIPPLVPLHTTPSVRQMHITRKQQIMKDFGSSIYIRKEKRGAEIAIGLLMCINIIINISFHLKIQKLINLKNSTLIA